MELDFKNGESPYKLIKKYGGDIEENKKKHDVDHLSVVYDDELKKHVLRMDMHPKDGDGAGDRSDRQRTEYKGGPSSKNGPLKAKKGDIVSYAWWFKMKSGMKGQGRFYHVFQIKAKGDGVDGSPLMTFGVRKKYFQLESARDLFDNDEMWELEKMWDKWIRFHVVIHYNDKGGWISVLAKDINGDILYEKKINNLKLWNETGKYEYVRPKLGLYRSKTGYKDDHSVYHSGVRVIYGDKDPLEYEQKAPDVPSKPTVPDVPSKPTVPDVPSKPTVPDVPSKPTVGEDEDKVKQFIKDFENNKSEIKKRITNEIINYFKQSIDNNGNIIAVNDNLETIYFEYKKQLLSEVMKDVSEYFESYIMGASSGDESDEEEDEGDKLTDMELVCTSVTIDPMK